MRITILLGFILLLSSCRKDIELPDSGTDRKTVVNCFFSKDSLWQIQISEDIPAVNAPFNFKAIEGAQIEVNYESDISQNTFSFVENSKGLGFYTLEDKVKGNAEEIVDISVQANGRTVLASSVLPDCPVIEEFEFNLEITEDKRDCDFFPIVSYIGNLSLKIPTEMNNQRYYGLKLSYLSDYLKDRENGSGDLIDTLIRKKLRVNPNTNGEVVLNYTFGNNAIFTNEIAENGEINLNISLSNFLEIKGEIPTEVKLELFALSSEYYDFITSYDAHLAAENDPFAVPVPVFNNIENGFGIFAGYCSVERVLNF